MNTLTNGIEGAEPGAAAAITADIRDHADPALVRADRVEQLYSQLPLGMAATIVIGVIAAMELHEGRLLELVLFWGGLLALVVVLHGLLYFGYRNDAQRHENTAQWLRWLGIGAFAAGATWGFAAAVFFPSHADERQVFLAFLLAGVVADLRRLCRGDRAAVHLRAGDLRQPAVRRDRAADSTVLRCERRDRLPPERRVRLG